MGKSIYDLREMLCEELENMTSQRGSLTGDRLKAIDMLTHSIKSIDTIIAMEDYSEDGRGNYDNKGSYAMRRNSYTRRNNRQYSRDDNLRQQLEDMMRDSDSKDRDVIKRFMEQMGM